jgi:hypothetical protein
MELLYTVLLLLPLPILLNRWRGTGTIFKIFKFELIGNIIYAIYLALVVGFSTAINHIMLPFTTIVLNGTNAVHTFTNTQCFSSIVFGVLGAGLYIAGESFAWGKWVGWLTDYDNQATKDYNNDDGRSFPYIHFIAQAIVKQEVNYTRYCQVALAIRGFVWWTPLLVLLGSIGLISWYLVIFSSLMLSIMFPISCYIGNMIHTEYRSKYLNMSRGWENQELVYGFFHYIFIIITILVYHLHLIHNSLLGYTMYLYTLPHM